MIKSSMQSALTDLIEMLGALDRAEQERALQILRDWLSGSNELQTDA